MPTRASRVWRGSTGFVVVLSMALASVLLTITSIIAVAQTPGASVTGTFSGLVFNRATQTFNSVLTLTNKGSTLNSPLSVTIATGSNSITVAGATASGGNSFVLMVPLVSGSLPASGVQQVTVAFSDPTRISFTPTVTSVTGTAGNIQSIATPTADPTAITANTPAQVLVRVDLSTVQNLVANSVNVQLVDANNNPLAVLGSLNDQGTNGDETAGDGLYSGIITLNQAQTGTAFLSVSATGVGGVQFVSNSFGVAVVPAGFPTQPHQTDLSQTDTDPVSGSVIIANEFLACFSPNTSTNTILATISGAGGTAAGRFPTGDCYQVQMPSGSTAALVEKAISAIVGQPGVSYAEPEYVDEAEACAFPTCTDTNSLSYQLLNLDQAHTISTGNHVRIAVIDSGLSTSTDQALQSLAIPGVNYTTANGGARNNTNDVPQFPHGTWVSGIVAATAPNATIVPYKVCIWNPTTKKNDCNRGLEAAAVAQAMLGHAKVINMSLGGYAQDKTMAANIASAIASGTIVVAAAGNDGKSAPLYPASYPGVVSVGGINVFSPVNNTNGTDTAWAFDSCTGGVASLSVNSSNWGPTIKISAPSVCIETNGFNAGIPAYCTGTSCASPFVAGTAALVFQKHPNWSAGQVSQQLINSAQSIWLYDASNNPIQSGTSQNIGPRLDSLAAVGGIRVTELGFDRVQLQLNIGFGTQQFIGPAFLGQGTQFGNSAPCEARANQVTYAIIQPCVRDFAVTPVDGQQYQLFVQLQGIENDDFDAYVDLTLPGLTYVSNTNSQTVTIVSPTRALFSLFGFQGGQHPPCQCDVRHLSQPI